MHRFFSRQSAEVSTFLRRGLIASVGSISWRPPAWLRALAITIRAHPRCTALLALAFILGGLGGSYAYTHRKIRTPPRFVLDTIIAPGIPPLADTSIARDLEIRFYGSAAALPLVDAIVPPNLVRLEPNQPGQWRWNGDRRLVFSPTLDWPAGQTFRVTLDRAALAPQVRLADYHFEVRTPELAAYFRNAEFYQNPKDLTVKQVTATLIFTHAVDPAVVERDLSVRMLGGTPVFGTPAPARLFSVQPGRLGREFFVRTVDLTLPPESDTMVLRLNAGLPAALGAARLKEDETARVRVPDLYSFFRIKDTSTCIIKDKNGNPEQFLFVETSCAARTEDLAKTLQVYALPPTNPGRHHAVADQSNSAADDDAGNDTDTDEGQEDDAGDQRGPPGDHDGRFHGDDDSQTREGTEAADAVDAPPFDDWAPDEVDAAALARARQLPVTPIPSHDEQSTTHTFRLRDDTPGKLYVKIGQGVPAPGGYRLRGDYTNVVAVPVPAMEIVLEGDGGLLALSGERKVCVHSRGVPAIRYEIARVPAAEINHLASQTEGDFQQPQFISEHFNEQDISRFSVETQAINVRNPVEANYSSFDFSAHLQPVTADGLDREGLFFLTASGFDPKTNKYLRGVQASRFILVTDLGLLVKRNGDGSRDVFVASVANGEPLGGVEISILARSGITLSQASTDAEGHASLPSLGKNPRDSREPVVIVARRSADVAFLPYERADRTLDFSRFPIEGVVNRTGHELDAFVFTERGVYRPGDTLHAGVIIKQRDWNGALAGLPIETEVVDARDQPVQVQTLLLPSSGFVEWSCDTMHDSPTGGYALNVYLRRDGKRATLLGSATVQVKEFLPDRLKLDAALSRTSGSAGHGWVGPEDLGGSVALKNLYGTAASDRLIKAHLRLNPRAFAFKEYPDFTFYDRLSERKKDWTGETIQLGDQQTDAEGKASFEFDLKRFADVTYRLTFDAEGFEGEGGRSVEETAATLVSPLPYVVGWRADGDLDWIRAGGPGRNVEFIGVDPALKRVRLDGLTLHLAERQFVSVLTRGDDGNYRYESVCRERPMSDEPAAVPESGWKYALPVAAPGRFVVELRDAAGLAISRFEYQVAGQGAVTRSLEKNAELEIQLSREQYNAGDQIEVSITAPYAGSGLITLERERVYAHRWFKSTGTSSVQTITIPADFDGSGYVNVSFVRALDSKEVFMSPLSYAVAPFTANKERRRLAIELRAPEKSKPGEPLAIGYRTDRPAKIVLFAVDQGILQVTRYALPDPLEYVFRKSALNVSTSQIVDLLLPEFSILRAAQSSGGDGDPGVLNPFHRVTEKPVVYWSGIVDADATERTVTYPVPDYFSGTLTIMAVAAAPDALGSVKISTVCRNAFVLTPGVPTLAAPGDEFEVGLTVANGAVGSGPDAQILVQAEPGAGLQILRGPSGPLHVPEGREASTTFRVRALDHLGSVSLGFRASGAGEDSRVHVTVSIRPAMPFRTLVSSGNFHGATHDVPVAGSGLYPEYRKLEASVSALPIGLARGLDRYLQEYPHGCSEQITSGAFARLALADVADFGLTRAEAAQRVEYAIGVERRRQNDQGGFGFWEAEKTPDIDFITVYVMHFLSEAKAAGYPVPEDMFQNGMDALQRAASASPWNLQQARIQAYALYVLTREGVLTTNHLLALEDYLNTYYKASWQDDLTGVYLAGCWSMLRKDDEARRLIDAYQVGHGDPGLYWDFYQPLCADAQYVTILARHFPERLRRMTPGTFEHVTRPIGDGDFSTLSAAYAVLALKAYSQAAAHDPGHLWVGALSGTDGKETPLALDGKSSTLLRGGFRPATTVLRFHADGGAGLAFYQAIQSGFGREVPAHASAAGIEVYRELLDAAGNQAAAVKLGDRVTVRLRLRSQRFAAVTNVAVLDLLPGGFEIADDSLKPGAGTAGMDYVDVREDRCVFYGTATGRVRQITYQIKPTCRGDFTVPPVFAESMYDRKIQSLGLGGHITVTEAK
jgi:uncharacterized protein YfaS (alpha-2-macroglobulin family)